MTIRTILITALTSTALVGFSISANAQTAKYNADDPFFGTGGINTAAEFYSNAIANEKAAAEAVEEANAAVVDPDNVTAEERLAILEAEKAYLSANTALEEAYNVFGAAKNGPAGAEATQQIVNDLRGENGLVDQEILVDGETVIQQGRVTIAEDAIGNNETEIQTNANEIQSNATDIENNATHILKNQEDIVTNVDRIGANQEAIGANTRQISDIRSEIDNNGDTLIDSAKDIDINSNDIDDNADNIATNKSDIIANTDEIGTNTEILNTLVDTEIVQDTGIDDDPETLDVDESKETVVRKGRVTVNEEAIASNTTDIHEVVDRISSAFQGLDNAAVNNNLKQVEVNSAAIAHNTSNIEANSVRLDTVEGEIDNLKGGVAMAIAIANAPVISNGANKFSLSGGLGYYDEAIALSVKGAFMPTDSIAITGSVASDLGDNYSFGAGVGMAF